MKFFKLFLIVLGLSLSVSAKVVTDKSKGFQFEVPDSFSIGSGNASSTYSSPDGQVQVSSLLVPGSGNKRPLVDIAKDYSAAQEKAGKVPQRVGAVRLGGKDAMAIEAKDKKGTVEMSFVSKGDRGIAILILTFKTPIKANPQMFGQLVCRSFRWLK